MTLSVIYTRAALGVCAPLITVEVHISNGLPGLTMVGLPETTVKEARDRVRSDHQQRLRFPAKKSPSTWRRRICPKREGDMIYLSLSRFSRPQSSCRLAIFINMSLSANWPLQGVTRRSRGDIQRHGGHQSRPAIVVASENAAEVA
jgi:magnesium chelatase family protein